MTGRFDFSQLSNNSTYAIQPASTPDVVLERNAMPHMHVDLTDSQSRLNIATKTVRRYGHRLDTSDSFERQLEQARDELLAAITHDLRAPLTMIVGYAHLLKTRRKVLSEAEIDEVANDLHHEARRLQSLVETALTVARLSSDERLPAKTFSLHRLLTKHVASHSKQYGDREIALIVADGLPAVSAHATALGQIIDNLLSNAEKYSPAGRPIAVIADRSGDAVRVRVLDRGVGLKPAETESIFRPFYRTGNGSGEASGTGIGLTLVRRLVEAQGGEIWAHGRTSGGAEFGFTVPIAHHATRSAPEPLDPIRR